MAKDVAAVLAALSIFIALTWGVFIVHQRYCLRGDSGFACRVAGGFVSTLLPARR